MHFAIWIPDWDSLDSVRWAHSRFELASIISFGILAFFDILSHKFDEEKERSRRFERIGLWFFGIAVACEIAAYIYGQRNDTLAEGVITSLNVKATDAATKAAQAVTDSGVAMGQAKEASGTAIAAKGIGGDAQTKANSASLAAGQAEKSALAATRSATEVGNREKQLKTDILETELMAASSASGEVFRPFLFRSVHGKDAEGKSEKLTVKCFGDASPFVWMFCTRLNEALGDKGYTVRDRPEMGMPNEHPIPIGATVFNPWITSDTSSITGAGAIYEREGDPRYFQTALGDAPPEATGKLMLLTMALGGKLVKDATLKGDELRILIGQPTPPWSPPTTK